MKTKLQALEYEIHASGNDAVRSSPTTRSAFSLYRERPILMSAPMIKALLAGTKSQTRRILKGRGKLAVIQQSCGPMVLEDYDSEKESGFQLKHPYTVGMRLWVKETFMPDPYCSANFIYRATEKELDRYVGHHWKPSIFMPRKASRIALEVTEVRVQRLNDISTVDAEDEGALHWWNNTPMEPGKGRLILHPKVAFQALWQSINGLDSWEKNPWVWAISFKRIQ